MKNIAIFGAGGFGREVHFLIQQINLKEQLYNFIGFFDDTMEKGIIVNNFPILGGINELNQWPESLSIAISIGNSVARKKIVESIHNTKINYPTLIHPNVLIGDLNYNLIGNGCIICGGVIITVNISIGHFVILNLSCTVGHDTNIGNYSSFMPSVNISGEVNIGSEVYVGTGAKIINKLNIGERAIIGAGAVVAKNLPSNCTAVGIPAKVIKIND